MICLSYPHYSRNDRPRSQNLDHGRVTQALSRSACPGWSKVGVVDIRNMITAISSTALEERRVPLDEFGSDHRNRCFVEIVTRDIARRRNEERSGGAGLGRSKRSSKGLRDTAVRRKRGHFGFAVNPSPITRGSFLKGAPSNVTTIGCWRKRLSSARRPLSKRGRSTTGYADREANTRQPRLTYAATPSKMLPREMIRTTLILASATSNRFACHLLRSLILNHQAQETRRRRRRITRLSVN